jgi:hypothetical protein
VAHLGGLAVPLFGCDASIITPGPGGGGGGHHSVNWVPVGTPGNGGNGGGVFWLEVGGNLQIIAPGAIRANGQAGSIGIPGGVGQYGTGGGGGGAGGVIVILVRGTITITGTLQANGGIGGPGAGVPGTSGGTGGTGGNGYILVRQI